MKSQLRPFGAAVQKLNDANQLFSSCSLNMFSKLNFKEKVEKSQ